MEPTWKIDFNNRIREYGAIRTLAAAELLDEKEELIFKANLLEQIIEDMREYVKN